MISKKFFQFFPVPKYLNPEIAGLSISDNHIRFLYIEETSSGLKLQRYREVELPKGIIVSGDIVDKDKVISILEDIRKECGVSSVRTSIQEEKAYLFELEIPLVERGEIKSTIEFKIEEHVPLKAEDIIFDYSIISQSDSSIKMIVSALPKTVVEIYEEVIISAGFFLYAIEIESQAITRAVVADNNNYLIVHFSKDKAGVYIVKNKLVHFTSTFLLMERSGMVSIPKEVHKIAHYFKDNYSKNETDNITKILLCGEISDDNLVSKITNETNINTALVNPWVNIFNLDTYIPPINKKDSIRFVSSIGLAIPQVNINV